MMTPRLMDKMFPSWLWRLPSGRKQIALTFDDGPESATTSFLLDFLKEMDVRVTFFLTGEKVKAQAALLQRMAGEGHTLGNHGYHHENHSKYPSDILRNSIRRTEDCVRDLGILPARFFRPPHGVFSRRMKSQLRHLDYRGVMWTAHVDDWRPQAPEVLMEKVRRAFVDGSIVLLHDGCTSAIRTLLQVLPALVEESRMQGFQFVPLGEAALSHY